MKLKIESLRTINFLTRTESHRWLASSMLFSLLLVMIRIMFTGSLTFIFLAWNLFLAFVPFAISAFLQNNISWTRHKGKFAFAFAVWVLFIPNAFYIITDLFHLGISQVPIWFELALLLSFAWNGLLLGILSVRQMERIIEWKLPGMHELFFLLPIMFLNAFGIYIGRYLRFNSWDVISNPFDLASDISTLLLHPFASKYAWSMISCYALLMTFIYITIKKISKSIL